MSKSGSSRSRNRLFLGAILLLVLLGAAVGLWLIFGRSAQALDLGPAINIIMPITGDVVEAGTQVQVMATGDDALGVTRLELYVNGVLTSVQENELPEGSTFLGGFDSAWIPVATGRHILMTRGYRADGRFADSGIVLVDVVVPASEVTGSLIDLLPASTDGSCPSLNQLAAMLGVSLEDLLLLNPGLRGTDANLPLSCGTVLTLPRPATPPPGLSGSSGGSDGSGGSGGVPGGDGSGGSGGPTVPAPLPGAPMPPAWVAVDPSACTIVRLTWTSVPEAEGYTLYRNAPGDSRMNAIAHVPAGQTTYIDTISLTGGYIYQVAAVRGGLEALSVVFSFNTGDYPACAASLRSTEPPAESSLYLIVTDLQTYTAYEGVYCYISVNGGAQGRLPEADFSSLTPLSDGLSYDLRVPPARGRYLLTRSGSDPVTIEIRCMGRRGVYSDSLGGFLASHPVGNWDGRELTSSSTGGRGAFDVHYCITSDPTLINCIRPSVVVSPVPPLVVLFPGPLGLALDLPAPSHLRIMEVPMWSNDPHLVWDWIQAGPYDESTLTGYHVVGTINGAIVSTFDIPSGRTKSVSMSLIQSASLPCGFDILFSVTAVQGGLQSPASYTLRTATPACPTTTRARVRVIFESLDLHADPTDGRVFDNGDLCVICRDNVFELNGYFSATTSGVGIGVPLEWYGLTTGINFVSIGVPGVYPLADQRLSSDWGATNRTGNNIIILDVDETFNRVIVSFRIYDTDFISSGQVCAGYNYSFALDPSTWQTADQTIAIHGDFTAETDRWNNTDSIGCTVNVRFVGVPMP